MADVLERFSPPVREWFATTFALPTPAQEQGWPAIADGDHTLILAPTGSGKTLAAFLWAIDRLMTTPVPPKDRRLRVLYVSPLRALAVDVDKNLRAPLHGIRLAAERLSAGAEGSATALHEPTVAVRTGDTPSAERQRIVRAPPDILITTPESLYLMLTSRARETLRSVEVVIVDEIHALAATKRGSHLALSLERLEEEVRRGAPAGGGAAPARAPQRIALSATQRPLDEVARFLGGYAPSDDERPPPRDVRVVDAGVGRGGGRDRCSVGPDLELEVVVPVEDMGELGRPAAGEGTDPADVLFGSGPGAAEERTSIWPAVHPVLLDRVLAHRSTLIFVNARRLAERLAAKLNELHATRVRGERLAEAGDLDADEAEALAAEPVGELVLAHHGSLSRERRLAIEDALKAGRLRGLVATSSLELGIDMGAVDQVVQVASPGAVSRGLQRVGRAGHRVGEPSRGTLVPKYRGDLVETAVVAARMRSGEIEATRYPRNPLDVLAQHLVAMTAMDEWTVGELAAVVRRAAPFAELSDEVLRSVLDLLAGRYPSDEFSELRPRIVWDRIADTVRARAGSQRLAVTNPGTIPDRGLFGVFLPDGARVGELDEEMVHESRPGETFLLGASTWRIEEITHERVVVTPAPGQPGKMPFWHGDGPGRPVELGRAVGAFVRETHTAGLADRDATLARLRRDHALDEWAATNLLDYLEEQAEVTGALPDDRTIVVERFRDEIGDWRVCLLSPFGAPVHAPWAMALERRLHEAGHDAEVMWADDGIVLRLQEAAFAEAGLPGADPGDLALDDLVPDPDDVERLVVDQLAGTALFTTVFREAAGRALLLPKRRPGQRTALWQQRQRAANLLAVAAKYPTFPLLLEATRECLRDVFDLPALTTLLRDVHSRAVRTVAVDTASASPFAQSLLFAWVGQYMYEYDAPLAERRAAALALDRDLLRELLGGDELRELIDPGVLADLELELAHLTEGRRARGPDGLHELLLDVGGLTRTELAARSTADPTAWVDELLGARRAITVRVADTERVAAAEDAARLRDGLGVALPPGLPAAFTDPVDDPLGDLVSRYARTHGPFLTGDAADRLGAPRERVEAALRHLERQDRVLRGEFRPDGVEREWCDVEVLRRLRRRSLAALRHEVEPVEQCTLARFLPAWHGVVGATHHTGDRRAATARDVRGGGSDALLEVVESLQGLAIPASVLERDVLPDRIPGYRPSDLDQLLATGAVVWVGAGTLGTRDGRVALCFRDQAALLAPPPDPAVDDERDPIRQALQDHLAGAGASFWDELLGAAATADPATGGPEQGRVLGALWDLVWAGVVTGDTYQPVRALLAGGRPGSAGRGRSRRIRSGRQAARLRRAGPPAGQGRWSLTAPLRGDPRPEEVATARAEQLLERHGVLTASGTRGEGVAGGFAGIYPVLKTMEEAGRVRRGYFVEGLGGAQFAHVGAIDRLRDFREPTADTAPVTLAATDPAQPYGTVLPWPTPSAGSEGRAGRPARQAGAYVVLVDGRPGAYLEKGGRSLVTFPDVAADRWLPALTRLVSEGRLRKLELTRVDGVDVHATHWPGLLEQAGFVSGPRGLALRERSR